VTSKAAAKNRQQEDAEPVSWLPREVKIESADSAI